ncbi:eukaryotic integral membrane protein-domain-containing protein [Plectosphaerella cucumerina]|uniref:Eukaryotic integral membrane protein-domain-containing protein n=1 Tax=Plectosphaerella cucumerina TaxID=40658 RepID=A0A8K0TLA4_9PEZI|nr:eukaryotic integral membrane protein-domain-containing protein [Plectosphaerella cucumerina]
MPPRINIPPVTRVALGALVVQSFLSAAIRYRQWTSTSDVVIPYLTLVPQLSLFYPWTFLSTTLVENNIFTISIAGATLYYGGRYLERAWSSAELAKFLILVALIPNALTFLVLIILFTLSRNEHWTLTVINGTVPLQISFLVAFSQLVPAHTVTLFRGILSLRVPRFPLVYIGIITALALSPLMSIASFFEAIFGLLVSWTYLRFYKKVFPDLDASQPTSLRGDASETFAFAEFFPGPVKPFVAAGANQIFEVLVAMKLCTPFSYDNQASSRGGNYIHRTVPGSARAEAERRRALALKTLDQRLHAATANTAGRAATSSPPAGQPSGPTVNAQPQPATQTAMTSQPSALLGETNYNPDHDDTHDGKNGA